MACRRCSEKEIFDEADVGHYCNRDPAISGRVACSKLWWVRGRIFVQQRQRRGLAERGLGRRRFARHQRRTSRTSGTGRIEEFERGSQRRGERNAAGVALGSGHQLFRYGAVVRKRQQYRQRYDHRFCDRGIAYGYHGPAAKRRFGNRRREQGGRSKDQEHLPRLLISTGSRAEASKIAGSVREVGIGSVFPVWPGSAPHIAGWSGRA